MYNAKELVDKGIITGPILDKNVQMHGVDLNLIAVKRVFNFILSLSKYILA